jgi:NTP pyrophosphatase (non-canonical NTP hydrolase)
MENAEYIEKALRTAPDTAQYRDVIQPRLVSVEKLRILHALSGLASEVGELFDQFKRHIIYGTELDYVNLAEEVGDMDWYRAELVDTLASVLGVSAGELDARIKNSNIRKLEKRFPEKFSETHAVNRLLEAERIVLEEGGIG